MIDIDGDGDDGDGGGDGEVEEIHDDEPKRVFAKKGSAVAEK